MTGHLTLLDEIERKDLKIDALQAELKETQNLLWRAEVPDMVPVLQAEIARIRGHLEDITQEWIYADAEARRLREALEYVAKFDGHHYAPLRACGEEAVKALKQNAVANLARGEKSHDA